MRLLTLDLDHFKGVRELHVDAGGRDVDAWGENATGKTTIADAITWLLFGRDSRGAAAFDIKTRGEDGEVIPAIDHSVRASFDLDGTRVELMRTYKETYTKKRGSAESEFSGHTTDYHVNTVPVSEREYADRIARICDPKQFKLLTDPRYFAESLPWQERREALLEMVGDVSDEEVIASDKSLADLPGLLGDLTLDEWTRILTQKRKTINEELKTLPARIDEASRAADPGPAPEGDREALIAEHRDLEKKLNDLRAGAPIEALDDLKAAVARHSATRDAARKRIEAAHAEASKGARVIREKKAEADDLKARIGSGSRLVEGMRSDLENLKVEYKRLAGAEFDGETVCAACGQELPSGRVQAAREAHRERTAKALEDNKIRGRALRAEIEAREAKLAEWKKTLGEIDDLLEEAEQSEGLFEAPVPDVDHDTEVMAAASEVDRLRALVAGSREQSDEEIAKIKARIDEIIPMVEAHKAHFFAKVARENAEKRVAELQTRKTDLGKALGEVERCQFLADQFVRARVRLLEDKVNASFEIAGFRLFAEQVNGGLAECCEVVVGGVPWASLNHGMQINVGLDIIDAFARKAGFAPPVVIDNAEAVTAIRPTTGQQIRLIVSAEDKTLRIETNKETK